MVRGAPYTIYRNGPHSFRQPVIYTGQKIIFRSLDRRERWRCKLDERKLEEVIFNTGINQLVYSREHAKFIGFYRLVRSYVSFVASAESAINAL
jgi:hypothetical protein